MKKYMIFRFYAIISFFIFKGFILKIYCILNIIGFYHEQSRIDRDKYVKILWRNIKPGRQDQFHKYDPSKAKVPGGAPYDTCSVMHYLSNAFAKVCKGQLISKGLFGLFKSTKKLMKSF